MCLGHGILFSSKMLNFEKKRRGKEERGDVHCISDISDVKDDCLTQLIDRLVVSGDQIVTKISSRLCLVLFELFLSDNFRKIY